MLRKVFIVIVMDIIICGMVWFLGKDVILAKAVFFGVKNMAIMMTMLLFWATAIAVVLAPLVDVMIEL